MQAKINITYEVWDQEALELGDTDDRGFLEEGELWDTEDLSRELEGSDPSRWPVDYRQDDLSHIWFTKSEENPYTGVLEVRSYHCAHDATSLQRQAWSKAVKGVRS